MTNLWRFSKDKDIRVSKYRMTDQCSDTCLFYCNVDKGFSSCRDHSIVSLDWQVCARKPRSVPQTGSLSFRHLLGNYNIIAYYSILLLGPINLVLRTYNVICFVYKTWYFDIFKNTIDLMLFKKS